MMHSNGNNELDFLLNGFMSLASGLRNIANSPGLPEMVRSDFNALADSAQCVVGPVLSMRQRDILNGQGPRSRAIVDAAAWLKIPTEGIDFRRLAPKVSFDWWTAPENADDSDLFMRSWSQFFYTQYPLECFSDEGQTVRVEYTVDGYTFEVNAVADIPKVSAGDQVPESVWIKEVQVSYKSKEGFWSGWVSFSRNSAMFRDVPAPDVSITHVVESVILSAPLVGIVPFMTDYVISPLVQRLGYSFKDYSLAGETGYRDNLKHMLDDIALEYPEHHQNHVRNIITRECSHMGCAKGVVVEVPGVGIVKIVTGELDLYDYDKWVEKTAQNSWYRDKPLLKIEAIVVAGVDISSRRIPTAWNYRITEAIDAAFRKIVTEYTWWPKTPEELAAEKAAKEQQ